MFLRVWTTCGLVFISLFLFAFDPVPCRALSGSVLLGFSASYVAPDGGSRTHRGMDVAVQGDVGAPRAGEVTFAGRVPGPHGGSVLAVTIETPTGTITMLPFAELQSKRGQRVEEGQTLGVVAAEGDPSTPRQHIHVGLKRNGLYIDPAELLAPIVAEEPQPAPVPQVAPKATPKPAPKPSAKLAPTRQPASAPTRVPCSAPVPVQPQAQGATAASGAGDVASGRSADSGAGSAVDERAGSISSINPRVAANAGAIRTGASSAMGAGAAHSAATTPARPSESGATAILASGVAALAFLVPLAVVRYQINRRVVEPPVSDRLGTMLQHLRAGDTLRGLTSCSGPTAFTVPGPPAQRR